MSAFQEDAIIGKSIDLLPEEIKSLLDPATEVTTEHAQYFPSRNDQKLTDNVSPSPYQEEDPSFLFNVIKYGLVPIMYLGFLGVSCAMLCVLVFKIPTELTFFGIIKKVFGIVFLAFAPLASLYFLFRKEKVEPAGRRGLLLTESAIIINHGKKVDYIPRKAVLSTGRQAKGIDTWLITLYIRVKNRPTQKYSIGSNIYKGLHPDELTNWSMKADLD